MVFSLSVDVRVSPASPCSIICEASSIRKGSSSRSALAMLMTSYDLVDLIVEDASRSVARSP